MKEYNLVIYDIELKDTKNVIDINLYGTIIPTIVLSELMSNQGHGSIINISSMASKQAISRVLGYSVAKAGIDVFTKWMANELASKFNDKLRVNAIAPGFFIGNQNRRLLINENGKDKVEPQINQNLPGEPNQNMNSNNKQLANSDLEGGPLENMDGPGGFCFGGMCDLSYSPLEEGDTINQDNYEYLDNSQNNEAGSKNKMQNDTRKEKSAQMDTDYERMMESRKMQQPEIRPR
jgi:hypothetical protein